jgi:cystathionine gamma-synthase
MKLETLAVHTGREIDPNTGAVTPSITLTTTFQRHPDGTFNTHVYTRASNPNRAGLETALAMLEEGAEALTFSSGMAAANALLQALDTGDHIVAPNDLYHGVRVSLNEILTRWGLHITYVDMRDSANISAAIRPNTKMVWVETPSNPMLNITDITQAVEIAHAAGAVCIVDNTWATPLLQQPLKLGADVAMHATTKYIGGHSDVLGGALVVRESGALAGRLRVIQGIGGAVPSPFDCWLLQRSLPTLPARMRIHCENAQHIAEFLAQHPRVERVHYPGLPSDPGHAVAMKQMRHPGGMLSIEVKGGRDVAMAVANRLKLFTHATSLGGVESLIEHRSSGEPPGSPTPPNLLRISVGIEHMDDLIADLDEALD